MPNDRGGIDRRGPKRLRDRTAERHVSGEGGAERVSRPGGADDLRFERRRKQNFAARSDKCSARPVGYHHVLRAQPRERAKVRGDSDLEPAADEAPRRERGHLLSGSKRESGTAFAGAGDEARYQKIGFD